MKGRLLCVHKYSLFWKQIIKNQINASAYTSYFYVPLPPKIKKKRERVNWVNYYKFFWMNNITLLKMN